MLFLRLLLLCGAYVLAAKTKEDKIDMDKTLHIAFEGWRHLPHSYALVAQNVLLEMIRRAERDENTEISFVDIPKPLDWKSVKGLYSESDTAKISLAQAPDKDEIPDIILRFSYPIDLSPPKHPSSVVYTHATAEYEVVPFMFTATMATLPETTEAPAVTHTIRTVPTSIPPNVHLMTPSNWSAGLFTDLGNLPSSAITIVPHGIDEKITFAHKNYNRNNFECVEFKEQTGIPLDAFVFLHIGAGTSNKNVAMLVHAFVELAMIYPKAVLVLKTLSSMYPQGKDNIMAAIREAQMKHPTFNTNQIIWMDDPYSNEFMAKFYRCANVYVAPYQSEGFNLPVLESIASGTPVIVPRYGSTDDFTTSDFARYIEASPVERLSDNTVIRRHLDVDAVSLLIEMKAVVDDAASGSKWLKKASKAAAEMGKKYTWRAVVDKMVREMAKDKPQMIRLLSKK